MDCDVAILWKSFKQKQDIYYRDKLLSCYMPFLKSIINFIFLKLPGTISKMDLESYGYVGLLDAINKYDLSRNIKFETYASYRIKGAIIDGIRKHDWLSKSERSRLKQNTNLDNLYSEGIKNMPIKNEATGEISSGESIADDKSRENFSYEENIFYMYSIDDPSCYEKRVNESLKYVENLCSAYSSNNLEFAERLENTIFLKNALKKLSLQEKKIVYYYYFKGMTLKQIGSLMNVTESRISQIHSRIINKLRKQFYK